MNVLLVRNSRLKKTFKLAAYCICLVTFTILESCSPPGSPNPTVSEISTTNSPTFNDHKNNNVANITTLVTSYTLKGDCDPGSYSLEYSYDNSTWTPIDGGCPASGKFSINLTVKGPVTVYCRAKGKFKYTEVAIANVLLGVPPTSNLAEFVISSRSDNEGGNRAQTTMSTNLPGFKNSNTDFILRTGTTGVLYDKE